MEDLGALQELAARVAARAAAIHRRGLSRAQTVDVKRSATDIVTEVDREAETAIVSALRAARPADAILAEEGTEVSGTSGVRWVIDPLDGTTNYYYRYPAFAAAIGVEIDAEPVVGVIHDSFHDTVYTGRTNAPAQRDGAVIRVSDKSDLSTALIGTGFLPMADIRRRQAEVLTGILPRVRDIRRSGSAAFDLCCVATGQLDGFFEFGLSPWDIVAGSAIATAAGAKVVQMSLRGFPTPLVIAANPALIDALADLVCAAALSSGAPTG